MNKRNKIIELIIIFAGSILGLLAVNAINIFLLMSLPVGVRMVVMLVYYWLIALIPIMVMIRCRDSLLEYGFSKEKVGIQILSGVLIGLFMSIILTLIPNLAGYGEYVNHGYQYRYAWQFVYDFIYYIFAIGCVEELVFRGMIYKKISDIFEKESIAMIGSSVLFGVFHILSGSILQMILTSLIGLFLCLVRKKVKNCTTLSLIIAHGVYDGLITVFGSMLL